MESAAVICLFVYLYGIYALVFVSEKLTCSVPSLVHFVIRRQLVPKYRARTLSKK